MPILPPEPSPFASCEILTGLTDSGTLTAESLFFFFEVSKACTYSAKAPLSNWWKQCYTACHYRKISQNDLCYLAFQAAENRKWKDPVKCVVIIDDSHLSIVVHCTVRCIFCLCITQQRIN